MLQSELGLALEPEETGTTFTENARIKAEAVMQASGLPAIADDSGLRVDALQRRPRCVLRPAMAAWTTMWPAIGCCWRISGSRTRAAHFHTSVVYCFPNGDVLEAEGDCHGTIAYAPQGENGFGYDPVFFVPEMRKTFGQLTPEEKNAISHRGVALRAFGEKLKEYMENH